MPGYVRAVATCVPANVVLARTARVITAVSAGEAAAPCERRGGDQTKRENYRGFNDHAGPLEVSIIVSVSADRDQRANTIVMTSD